MKVYSVGQVAKICNVAPRTVSKWFDSGRLRGYRVPGTQDRRIPREYLIKFLKAQNMPLGDLEDEAVAKVLIVTQDQTLIGQMKKEFSSLGRSYKVAVASSSFDAGIQAQNIHPDCVIVDFSIGRAEALLIHQNVRRDEKFETVILIALLPDVPGIETPTIFDSSDVQQTFRKPFDTAWLAEHICTLIETKKELV